MIEENIGLLTCRQISSNQWIHSFVSTNFVDDSSISNKTRERTYIYPLYLYPDKNKIDLFTHRDIAKKPNISQAVFEKLNSDFGTRPSPEEIFYYIYSIFYSKIFREKYVEFLKIDFPRVPFTSNYDLFLALSKFGEQLSDLHLLRSKTLEPPIAKFIGKGENDRIEKIKYSDDENRIYINNDKYFIEIESEVWNYCIGGYQVLHKYLKDRKGRMMDDAPRYCRIVTALSKTIEIQKEIDKIYPEVEKDLIEF